MTASERAGDWLGGSDLAPVMGKGQFNTKLDIYLKKVGEGPKDAPTLAMRMGTNFEAGIADLWAEDQGLKLRRVNKARHHKDHFWLHGHFDRVIEGKREGVEVKSSSADDWGEAGTDQVPIDTLIQCHTYLAVSDYDRWHVAALLWQRFGPPELRHYIIEPDADIAGKLIEAGERFLVDHVRKRIPPKPQTSEEADKLWRRIDADKIVVATEDHLSLIGDREAYKAQISGLERRVSNLDKKLKGVLEDREAFVNEEGDELFRWPVEFARRFDQSRFQKEHPDEFADYCRTTHHRTLRITKHGKAAVKSRTEEKTE